MATPTDRVAELVDEKKRRRRELITPEGVALNVQIAGAGERAAAFILDLVIMLGAIVAVLVAASMFLSRGNLMLVLTVALFAAFVVRNAYFIHYELTTRGRTPGKKICGLWVINRYGGELPPSAIIARNLTREIEFFLPASILLHLGLSRESWWLWACLGWLLVVATLPLWNREHLRLGDVIAGTQVIAMPKRALSYDLTREVDYGGQPRYTFTDGQLSIYGAFELQVLEELLRQPRMRETERQLEIACEKICNKIGWTEYVHPLAVRQFLADFYTAQRAVLERGQLFGKLREDKRGGRTGHGRG